MSDIVLVELGKSKVTSFPIIPDKAGLVANIITEFDSSAPVLVEDIVITPQVVYVGDLVTIRVKYRSQWRKYG